MARVFPIYKDLRFNKSYMSEADLSYLKESTVTLKSINADTISLYGLLKVSTALHNLSELVASYPSLVSASQSTTLKSYCNSLIEVLEQLVNTTGEIAKARRSCLDSIQFLLAALESN